MEAMIEMPRKMKGKAKGEQVMTVMMVMMMMMMMMMAEEAMAVGVVM